MTLIEREFLSEKIIYKTPTGTSGYAKDLTYSTENQGKGEIIFKKQDIIKVSEGEDFVTDMQLSTNLTLPVNTIFKIKGATEWYVIKNTYKKKNRISRINFYLIKKYGGIE